MLGSACSITFIATLLFELKLKEGFMQLRRFGCFAALSVALASAASPGKSQTWVCDVEAAIGFDSNRGYQALNFRTNISYTVKANINPNDLTRDFQRNHNVFEADSDIYSPASLQQRGANAVVLCIKLTHPGFSGGEVTRVTCENTGHYGDKFEFNLNTGTFSHVFTGFELTGGGQSWVEVGECRRTM